MCTASPKLRGMCNFLTTVCKFLLISLIQQVSRLELEYEIQCKIISAAVRLSKEKGIDKSIKKERLQAAQRAQVTEIFKICIMRVFFRCKAPL